MLHKLKRDLEQSPVIRMGNYDYFVSPITDGIPKMDPDILAEVIEAMIEVGDFDCDMITTPEAMGIPIAVGLSQRLHIPYNVIRKRRYGLPGEITVSQRTGYSARDLYINGIKKGDKIVFVDDVLSTGGTLIAIISALIELGAIIKDVIIVVEKGNVKSKIEKTTGVRIKTLVRVDLRDGRVVVST